MKSHQEVRMECLRLAQMLAVAKVIKPEEIETRAEHMVRFVRDEPVTEVHVDTSRLRERFTVR